jgi:hypothetical protein
MGIYAIQATATDLEFSFRKIVKIIISLTFVVPENICSWMEIKPLQGTKMDFVINLPG